MFNRKIKKEIERVDDYYRRELRNLNIPETVECEKCGCLLRKETATPKIITEKVVVFTAEYADGSKWEDTVDKNIVTYYCKIHKPKK